MADLEASVMRKVAWHLVPFVSLAYLINILDRFNRSFAALTRIKALGLSATAYGLGAGAFFWALISPVIVVLTLVYVLVGFGVYGKAYSLPLMMPPK